MQRKIVISCFDLSCIMLKPWADAGYECHAVDVQHPPGCTVDGNIIKWGMDVREWEQVFFEQYKDKLQHVVFAVFFPPCTDLATSGACWFASKEAKNPGTRQRAMDLVYWSDKVGKMFECPYFVENPVSVISTEWRKPDYMFHPFMYGGYAGGEHDGYTKKTCLWTGGGFEIPDKKCIPLDPKLANKIRYIGPSAERQNLRSQTPAGFARAIFEHFNIKT